MRIEMSPNGGDAMHVGALQPEPHARCDVVCGPELSVPSRKAQSTLERAIGARARNHLPLVEMSVHIDQGRPDLSPAEIDPRWRPVALDPTRTQCRDAT